MDAREFGVCYYLEEEEYGVKIWKWMILISFTDKKPRFLKRRYNKSVKNLQDALRNLQSSSPTSPQEVWEHDTEA